MVSGPGDDERMAAARNRLGEAAVCIALDAEFLPREVPPALRVRDPPSHRIIGGKPQLDQGAADGLAPFDRAMVAQGGGNLPLRNSRGEDPLEEERLGLAGGPGPGLSVVGHDASPDRSRRSTLCPCSP